MLKAKVTQVGTSSGIVLSREVLAKLRVQRGDEVYLIETPHGFMLVPYNPEFEEDMEKAKEVLREYRDVFHMLAKS